MNEQDNPTPKKTVNWFRPHVKDLKAQENAQKEQLHPDTILGTLATAAFAGIRPNVANIYDTRAKSKATNETFLRSSILLININIKM